MCSNDASVFLVVMCVLYIVLAVFLLVKPGVKQPALHTVCKTLQHSQIQSPSLHHAHYQLVDKDQPATAAVLTTKKSSIIIPCPCTWYVAIPGQ